MKKAVSAVEATDDVTYILEFVNELKEIAYAYSHATDFQSRKEALIAWRRATAVLGLDDGQACRARTPRTGVRKRTAA